jgi:hypothetical protein
VLFVFFPLTAMPIAKTSSNGARNRGVWSHRELLHSRWIITHAFSAE